MTAQRPDDGSRWIWAILAGLAVLLFGMAAPFAIIGSRLGDRAEAARSWPTTEGVIVRSEVTEHEYRDPKDGETRSRLDIDFAYTYEVDGRRHEGHDYDVTGGWDGSDLRRIAAAHPPGAHVRVYYDPSAPARAGLSNEGTIMAPLFVRIGALLGAIGLVFAFFSARSLLRRRSSVRAPYVGRD